MAWEGDPLLSKLAEPTLKKKKNCENNTNIHIFGMAQVRPRQGSGKAYFGFLEYEIV